ncbi:hypothetical protein ABTY20_12010 [Streptomyces sp. NPDC126497]|uniref:hypothetical protein n=1 Tax=Streptomyces sp. NPDC126497 TaxID=3155313 RepID=UPI003321EF8D
MALPDPAKPDDITEAIVASVFGPHSLVLHVFVVASWLLAWYALARTAHRRARSAAARVSAIPGAQRVRAAFYAAVTPVVQAVYLALSYFIAAHLESAMRTYEGPADVDVAAWLAPADDATQSPVFWMWFTVGFLLVVSGWWGALDPQTETTPFHPIAWFLFSCGAFSVPVLLFLNQTMSILALVYVVTAFWALYLPRTCVRAWRTRV